jgi:hypothetical protein
MKLKNYKELFEQYDGPEDDDDYYGRPSYGSNQGSNDPDWDRLKGKYLLNGQLGDDDDDDDDMDDDDGVPSEDMENLLYLLRTLFKSSGVDIEIENKGLDITIYSILNKRQKMSSILKVLNVVKKLKTDILPQYESEFELWETKSGEPMFTFNFMYEGSDGDPDHDGSAPF